MDFNWFKYCGFKRLKDYLLVKMYIPRCSIRPETIFEAFGNALNM